MQVSPSILSADFGRINEEIASVDSHCDFIHVDVMDWHFVPNLTFWAPVVRCLKSKKPLDCHLMITDPVKYIPDFIKAWAYSISTHIELWIESVIACRKLCSWIKYGVAINPSTSLDQVLKIADKVDFFLVMSVNPGFGWQSFIPEVLSKVRSLKSLYPNKYIQIDWWIDLHTATMAKEAWVDNVVAGSFIFGSKDRIKTIQALQSI